MARHQEDQAQRAAAKRSSSQPEGLPLVVVAVVGGKPERHDLSVVVVDDENSVG